MKRVEVLKICQKRKIKMKGNETKDDLSALIAAADANKKPAKKKKKESGK